MGRPLAKTVLGVFVLSPFFLECCIPNGVTGGVSNRNETETGVRCGVFLGAIVSVLGQVQTHLNPHQKMLCGIRFFKNCTGNGGRGGVGVMLACLTLKFML